MELPVELTRLPFESLELLRYMGRHEIEAADAEALAEGTSKSERGIRKAIRGLVTAGYLNMDSDYVYFLTEKGTKATQDIAAYDAANPDKGDKSGATNTLQESLIAVTHDPLGWQAGTAIQFGLENAPTLDEESQLVLRLTSSNGSFAPQEITLNLKPHELPEPVSVVFTPPPAPAQVRVRVEALQLMNMADVHPAGGMFFDLAIGTAPGQVKAWYGEISLQA